MTLRVTIASIWRQGICSSYRVEYWRFLTQIFRNWSRDPAKLWLGFTVLLTAHHFINYAQVVAGELEAHCRSVEETKRTSQIEMEGSDWLGQTEAL